MIKNWLNKYNLLFNQFAFVEDILLGTEVTGGGNFVVFQHSVDVVFRKSAQGLKQFFAAAATAKTVLFTFGDAQIVGVEQAVQQLFRGQFGVKTSSWVRLSIKTLASFQASSISSGELSLPPLRGIFCSIIPAASQLPDSPSGA